MDDPRGGHQPLHGHVPTPNVGTLVHQDMFEIVAGDRRQDRSGNQDARSQESHCRRAEPIRRDPQPDRSAHAHPLPAGIEQGDHLGVLDVDPGSARPRQPDRAGRRPRREDEHAHEPGHAGDPRGRPVDRRTSAQPLRPIGFGCIRRGDVEGRSFGGRHGIVGNRGHFLDRWEGIEPP